MSMNEATVQAHVRLLASREGWRLFRNNVGVLLDSRGVPVRYGLANDSKKVNEQVKSGDLIGIRPVVITAAMVGHTLGQFASLEIKASGWKPRANDEHEIAQRKWASLVNEAGGYAIFSTGNL